MRKLRKFNESMAELLLETIGGRVDRMLEALSRRNQLPDHRVHPNVAKAGG